MNVALPSIRTDLGASVTGLQWVVDSYTFTLASLLILSGSTADLIGRRRTFQTGLASFTLGSALCSMAPNLTMLILARIVQAVGGSMLNPVAMAIITNVFTERAERAKAIGIWGGVVGISMGLGPVIGGLLIQTVGWRWIFWINIPTGLLAIVLAQLFVPESKALQGRRFDPVGQLLVIVMLGTLTYAIVESGRLGWHSAELWSILAVSAIALVGLLLYEPRRRDPLIELRFFTPVPYLIGCCIVFAIGFGLVNAPITNTAVSGMPNSAAGVAAAVASTSRQIGATLGVAVIGSVLAAGAVAATAGGPSDQASGILAGAPTGWWVITGCGLAVLGIGIATTGPWARSTVGRVADLMRRDTSLATASTR